MKTNKGHKRLSWRQFLTCCLGVTAVEFALVAPAFFGLIYGTIETGRFFYVKSALQNAVDQSGRFVTLNTTADDTTITDYVKTRLLTDLANSTTFTISSDTVGTTDFKTVSAAYEFDILLSLISVDTVAINVQARVPISD
ncbi:MAG: pilus assembly protein [Rhodospirillaceae bacterium]|jgi:Flp pilus assembly protein TadG|nr:pilus assembly protein [Rhodospirillaceae bacterium]MBT4589792.1 pilus assembly protein [Rhodospirillaceae bacterium]MBT5938407.1 pilus assembly protein [Rhodospirillaceae bacterium]MBT7268185.1 pilus assembly protein [Rhodospirillaceae bacterium]